MGDFRANGLANAHGLCVRTGLPGFPRKWTNCLGPREANSNARNGILSVALDEALALCEQEQFTVAKERVIVFAGLFDRLAMRLWLVIAQSKNTGLTLETLPNVTALDSENFRGTTAQRISFMGHLLAKIVFRGRTRFFSQIARTLERFIEELQKETRAIVEDVSTGRWCTRIAPGRNSKCSDTI